MKRLLALLTLSLALGLPAQAQFIGPPTFVAQVFNYTHITTDTTTTAKSGAGLLGAICLNTPASGETVTLYDNTVGSGTVIAVITESSTSIGCFYYNVNFKTGLTAVTATAAGDVTLLWQ